MLAWLAAAVSGPRDLHGLLRRNLAVAERNLRGLGDADHRCNDRERVLRMLGLRGFQDPVRADVVLRLRRRLRRRFQASLSRLRRLGLCDLVHLMTLESMFNDSDAGFAKALKVGFVEALRQHGIRSRVLDVVSESIVPIGDAVPHGQGDPSAARRLAAAAARVLSTMLSGLGDRARVFVAGRDTRTLFQEGPGGERMDGTFVPGFGDHVDRLESLAERLGSGDDQAGGDAAALEAEILRGERPEGLGAMHAPVSFVSGLGDAALERVAGLAWFMQTGGLWGTDGSMGGMLRVPGRGAMAGTNGFLAPEAARRLMEAIRRRGGPLMVMPNHLCNRTTHGEYPPGCEELGRLLDDCMGPHAAREAVAARAADMRAVSIFDTLTQAMEILLLLAPEMVSVRRCTLYDDGDAGFCFDAHEVLGRPGRPGPGPLDDGYRVFAEDAYCLVGIHAPGASLREQLEAVHGALADCRYVRN